MDEVHLDLAVDPLALVTAAEARDAFERVLLEPLGRLPYLVTSPVTLDVVCPTRPSREPGLVEYPNIDRWLRPLTDALAGAERLLLGGSQVMTVNVTTTPPSADQRRLSIRVTSVNARRVPKTDLRLVAFPAGWCACVPTSLSLPRAQATARRLAARTHAGGGRHLVQQGFIRRRDVAPDIPVVDAGALLNGPDESLPLGTRSPALAGPLAVALPVVVI